MSSATARFSVGRIAYRACTRRFPSVLRIFLLQLGVRLLALLPLIVCFIFDVQLHIGSLPACVPPCILTALLYLLLVFPMRSHAAYSMVRLVCKDDNRPLHLSPYPRLVLAGIVRIFSGLIWGIPFFLLLFRTYQYVFVLPVKQFNQDFTAIGAFFAASADTPRQLLIGSYLFISALMAAFLLFLYGWWRGTAFDFQMIGCVTLRAAWRAARRARRLARAQLWNNLFLHTLLLLPAILVPFLMIYLKLLPMLTGRAMNDLQLIYVFLSAGMISDGTLYLAAAAFLLLYLPFLPYRKLRNAAAVVNCHGFKR